MEAMQLIQELAEIQQRQDVIEHSPFVSAAAVRPPAPRPVVGAGSSLMIGTVVSVEASACAAHSDHHHTQQQHLTAGQQAARNLSTWPHSITAAYGESDDDPQQGEVNRDSDTADRYH
jgi:hypothetical protein